MTCVCVCAQRSTAPRSVATSDERADVCLLQLDVSAAAESADASDAVVDNGYRITERLISLNELLV